MSQRPWEGVLVAEIRSSGLTLKPSCLPNIQMEMLVLFKDTVLEFQRKCLGCKCKFVLVSIDGLCSHGSIRLPKE